MARVLARALLCGAALQGAIAEENPAVACEGTAECEAPAVDGGEEDVASLLSVRGAADVKPHLQPGACISEPEDYKTYWYYTAAGTEKPKCVDKSLWGSVYTCGDMTLYPRTAEKAWIFGQKDLYELLQVRNQFTRADPYKVSAAAFVIVGFGPPALDDSLKNLCLAVFKLPQGKPGLTPQKPTWDFWFTEMKQAGHVVDLKTQKTIKDSYDKQGLKINVLEIFGGLTGCSVDDIETKPEEDAVKSCSVSAQAVYNGLGDLAQQGETCVDYFFTNAGPKTWSTSDAGDVRMMLWRCFDVNPYNTGIGKGWNSYPNPVPPVCKIPPNKQTNLDHYTGEEFVIANRPINTFVSPAWVPFPPVTAAQNSDYITNGFC